MGSGKRISAGECVYRAILRTYPRAFLDRHRDNLVETFRLLEGEARDFAWWALPPFWIREITMLLLNAVAVRFGRRARTGRRRRPRGRVVEVLATIAQDIQFAARPLKRSPVFALVVILTLAFGIAANSAVFSVVNGVLLRPLPYPSPEKLLLIWDGLDWIGIPRAWVSPAEVHDLRERTTLFEGIAAIWQGSGELSSDRGSPEVVQTGRTTSNLFSLLGVTPTLGRALVAADEDPGREQVALLSYDLWTLRFGRDPGVIGSVIHVDGTPTTLVGVLPPEFTFKIHSSLGEPHVADLWLPLQMNLADQPRGEHFLAVVARVRNGASVEQAEAELASVSEIYDAEFYGNAGFAFTPVSVHDDLVKDVRPALLLLLASVGFVLLIATTNIATLLLARTQQRGREFAVRRALGAGRGRIVRQLVTESVTVSLLGGLVGLAIAWGGLGLVVSLAPADLPRAESVRIDPLVFAYSLALSVLVGVMCGLAPAVPVSDGDLSGTLREGRRGNTSGPRMRRTRDLLVVMQYAMSLVLLVGTALLIQSLIRLQRVDPGFVADDVLTVGVPLPSSRYPEGTDVVVFVRNLLDRVSGLPGVQSAGVTSSLPLTASATQTPAFKVVGEQADPDDLERMQVDNIIITPGYLDAIGMTLLAGRDFTQQDRSDSRPVALIDEILAKQYWPGVSALGRQLRISGVTREVVGVVKQARQYRIHEDDRPQVYVPLAHRPFRSLALAVRGTSDPASLARSVRGVIAELDPAQAVSDVSTMPQVVGTSLAERKFTATFITGFGFAALLLAAIGLYGVITYMVSQQTQEIGVRLALGARRGDVLRLVLGHAGRLVALGLAVGLVGTVAGAGAVAKLVYGVSARDPATLAGAALFLGAVASIAAYLPARRASRLDPAIAIRAE